MTPKEALEFLKLTGLAPIGAVEVLEGEVERAASLSEIVQEMRESLKRWQEVAETLEVQVWGLGCAPAALCNPPDLEVPL